MIKNHLMNVKQLPSPNTSGALSNPTLLVLHYTASGGTGEADAKYFQTKGTASAHLVIDRDGTVVQCVPFNKKAWHAGVSTWRGRTGANSFSIGIEIDNWGLLTKRADGTFISHTGTKVDANNVIESKNKRGNPGFWETYPYQQLCSVERVIDEILESYPSIREIVGHEDISPGRKIDPGPALYDFQRRMNNKLQGGRIAETPENDFREVNINSLIVRAGPGSNHSMVGGLKRGQKVRVLYDSGEWSKIEYNNGEAWVFDQYLT